MIETIGTNVVEFKMIAGERPAVDANANPRMQDKQKKAGGKFDKVINAEVTAMTKAGSIHPFNCVKAFATINKGGDTKGMRKSSITMFNKNRKAKINTEMVNAETSMVEVRNSRATKTAISNMSQTGDVDFDIDYNAVAISTISIMSESDSSLGNIIARDYGVSRMPAYVKAGVIVALKNAGSSENGITIHRTAMIDKMGQEIFETELMNRIGDAIIERDGAEKGIKAIDKLEKQSHAIKGRNKVAWMAHKLAEFSGVAVDVDADGMVAVKSPVSIEQARQLASFILEAFIKENIIQIVSTKKTDINAVYVANSTINNIIDNSVFIAQADMVLYVWFLTMDLGFTITLVDGVLDTVIAKVITDSMGERTGTVFVGEDIPDVTGEFSIGNHTNIVGDTVNMVVGGKGSRYQDTSVPVAAINNLQSTKLKVDVDFMAIVEDLQLIF